MSYSAWPEYVSVATRRHRAERELAQLRKQGQAIVPIRIEGRNIATTFWGKSWCSNLERYSDYVSRLPRGRSYLRNGAVLDLRIAKGEVAATVAGSSLYQVKISIAPVKAAHWKAVCRDCAGTIDTLVELLQGRLAKSVMDRVCRADDGLFPTPKEIKLSCSCPDWADMCKHVAATLYGVGARLDQQPQLLFVLRGVDETELLTHAGPNLAQADTPPGAANRLDDGDVAALFGLEMADSGPAATTVSRRRQGSPRSSPAKTAAAKKAAADNKVAKGTIAKKASAEKASAKKASAKKRAGKASLLRTPIGTKSGRQPANATQTIKRHEP